MTYAFWLLGWQVVSVCLFVCLFCTGSAQYLWLGCQLLGNALASLLPLKNNSPQTVCCNSSSVNLIVQSDYLVKKSVLFNLVNSVHFKLNI